jgi:hypothetical protein
MMKPGQKLEQLMAFTVSEDHARQEQVWNQLSRGHNAAPYNIRRQLTEGSVPSTNKRAIFVGVESYEKAGGVVLRDLFDEDGRCRRRECQVWHNLPAVGGSGIGSSQGCRRTLSGPVRLSQSLGKPVCCATRIALVSMATSG